MAAQDVVPLPAAGAGLPFGTRTEMFPAMPYPDFNAPGGPAYAAQSKDSGGPDLAAVLCNRGLPVRADALAGMKNIDHPTIIRLMDSGVVAWPDGVRHFAIAYQRPAAPRFKQTINEPHALLSEDVINNYFVTPLIGGLLELQRTGVVHHGIRTNNVFWRLGTATPPQLGECLSAPPGPGQPALFETLERAMATPLGRGTGSHSDDCYAFGVTLALLILGHNPLKDMDERGVIRTKIDRGSFGALIGNSRLAPTHSEILRGLLTDDTRLRWTATELEQWLTGRRLTPKNPDLGRRAQRNIEFVGHEYSHGRPLAAAMAENPSQAMVLIESGALDKWLRRALGDDIAASNLDDAITSVKEMGKSAHYESQLIARTCIALDPSAPIRYRGVSVMPGGIATLIIEAILTAGDMQPLAEIISTQLVTFWVNMQKETKTDMVPLGQQFERMKTFIEKTTMGNGVERVIYELNPSLQCLSPILRSSYVTSPKAMMLALEQIAGAPNRPHEPMDRHIAAFLIVRDRRNRSLFDAMTAPDTSPRKGVALLTLYSDMQYKHGPDAVPQLAQWLLPFLEVSVRRYLSKALRDKVLKQIRETASRGDLNNLVRFIDDFQTVERDQQEFLAARILYLNILKEVAHIEGKLANRDSVIQNEGKPAAASFSAYLAIIMVFVAIVRAIWQNLQG